MILPVLGVKKPPKDVKQMLCGLSFTALHPVLALGKYSAKIIYC